MNKYKRRDFLKITGASIPLALSKPSEHKAAKRTNFVIMMTDDSSPFSYEAYGNDQMETPNLSAFARESVRFNRAYCTSPQCSPARSSVLTGQMPNRVFASRLHAAVPHRIPNLVKILNKNGYYTGAFGKTHQPLIQEDFKFYANYGYKKKNTKPFDTFFDSLPDGQPFFLWFGSWNPHRPYNLEGMKYPNKFSPKNLKVPEFLPDTELTRLDLSYYYNKLFEFDESCGKLLQLLKDKGFYENTVVIQTSDHGMPFPRAKATLFEPGIRIPLVIRWPERIKGGTVSESLVSTMDLPATFLDIAGITIPEDMQSKSLLPILEDEKKKIHDHLYVERDWHDNWDPLRALITERYKLIQRYRPEFPFTPSLDIKDSLSFQEIARLSGEDGLQGNLRWYTEYLNAPRPQMDFYDLEQDPGEWNSLATTPYIKKDENPLVYEYQVELSRAMNESNDFLPPPRLAFTEAHAGLNARINPLDSSEYKRKSDKKKD